MVLCEREKMKEKSRKNKKNTEPSNQHIARTWNVLFFSSFTSARWIRIAAHSIPFTRLRVFRTHRSINCCVLFSFTLIPGLYYIGCRFCSRDSIMLHSQPPHHHITFSLCCALPFPLAPWHLHNSVAYMYLYRFSSRALCVFFLFVALTLLSADSLLSFVRVLLAFLSYISHATSLRSSVSVPKNL